MKSKAGKIVAAVLLVVSMLLGAMGTAVAAEPYRFKYADPEETIISGYTGTLPATLIIPKNVVEIQGASFKGASIEELVISARTSVIGRLAFRSCANLKKVQMARVEEIGDEAFADCVSLESIDLGSGLKTIGDSAFQGCTALSNVVLPDRLQEIDDYAFSGCGSLQKIVIPDSVTKLGFKTFASCDDLHIAVIGNGISYVPTQMFSKCKNLGEVILGDGIETIGQAVFERCGSLKNIQLPTGLKSIGFGAFQESGIVNLLLPEQIEHIYESIVHNCYGLEVVYLPRLDNTQMKTSFFSCRNLKLVLYGGSAYEWDKEHGYGVNESNGVKVEFDAPSPVLAAPTILQQPGDAEIEVGDDAEFFVSAKVDDVTGISSCSMRYQWQEKGSNTEEWQDIGGITGNDRVYIGATSDTLDIIEPTLDMNGQQYRCIITNANDRSKSTESKAVTLTVKETPELMQPELLPGSGLTISENSSIPTLTGPTLNHIDNVYTVSDIVDAFSVPEGTSVIVIGSDDAPVSATAPIATGNQVLLKSNDGTEEKIPVVVKGDVLGTGRMSLSQLVRMSSALSGAEPLTGVYQQAGDWTGTGSITLSDLVREANVFQLIQNNPPTTSSPTPRPTTARPSAARPSH